MFDFAGASREHSDASPAFGSEMSQTHLVRSFARQCARFQISFAAHPATMSRRLSVIEHNQEQSCQTMKLKRAIAAIVLVPFVSAFAAPVAAGTFEDAVDAHARGDYAKALRLIRPLANDGNATAQFNLGVMYLAGHGVQQDYSAQHYGFGKLQSKATPSPIQSRDPVSRRPRRGAGRYRGRNVVSQGADQGDAIAEFLLGNQYANGKGVPQDYSEAMIWFRRAAAQGHPVASSISGS